MSEADEAARSEIGREPGWLATSGELRSKEDPLRRREAQLRDFIENAPLGLHSVGPDGTILWANRAELDLLGYAEAEYIGRSIHEFHADADAIEDILARLNRGEALHDYEARMRAKDGSIKHVLISSNVYAPDGKFVHTRCFTRDVTDRVTFERFRTATAAHAERLSKVTAAMADAVTAEEVFAALVDRVGEAVDASSGGLWLVDDAAATARLVRARGYSEAARQQLREMPLDLTPSIPVLDAIRHGEPIWLPSQEALLARYPHVRAVTTPGLSYRIACLPLTARGRVLGALGLTIEQAGDATDDERDFLLLVARYASQAIERLRLFDAERRLHREALDARTRAEQLYRFAQAVVVADRVEVVFDAALTAIETALGAKRSAILTFDDDGVMRFRAWRNLSDAYRGEVEGHSPWSRDEVRPAPIIVPDPTADPAMTRYLPLFAKEGIGALAFIPLVTGDRLVGKFMVYYDQPHSFVVHEIETARAIGNHLASVVTRFAAVAKLEETIRYNEIFAGILAHDLRNPLGAIMTSAQRLLMPHEGESAPTTADTKLFARILASGQRINAMIDQVLDLTKARLGGGIEVQARDTNLAQLCEQAVRELELAHPDWSIDCDVVGDLNGRWDPERLLQVFSNLIANAGQHGEREAGVRIRLLGSEDEHVAIEVHNMGAVPESLLPHLFDPFRGTQRSRHQSRGLGLGLFIVREIVRAHGGTVDVSSSEATGTTFAVRLPRVGRAGGHDHA
jgi:PAS domain S-box-containing protein